VTIQGVSLTNGTYTYTYLASNFPNNFEPGGSGSITVGSNSNCPVPTVSSPASQTRYAGQTATFSVSIDPPGPVCPPSVQWQAGASGSGVFTNLIDGAQISGSATTTLTITNLTLANAGDYVVVATNSSGSVTSTVGTLT